jgi:hypothetical protein
VAKLPATVYSMEHITSVADQVASICVSSTLTIVMASPVRSTAGIVTLQSWLIESVLYF